MSCGVGCRHGLDPVLLWRWCRLEATAPIEPLAWEPPYATGVALKRHTKKDQKKKSQDFHSCSYVLGNMDQSLTTIKDV